MIIRYFNQSLLHFLKELAKQIAEVFIGEQHFVALLGAFGSHRHALRLRPQLILSDLCSLLVDDPPLFVSDHVLLDLEDSIVRVLFILLLSHDHSLALFIDNIVIQTPSQVHHTRLLVRHLSMYLRKHC